MILAVNGLLVMVMCTWKFLVIPVPNSSLWNTVSVYPTATRPFWLPGLVCLITVVIVSTWATPKNPVISVRLIPVRVLFVTKRGHISYHYNRALDRDRDLPSHKRARQQAPASSVTSRRIATPSRRTRPDAPLNFNFEESYSPAAPAPPASSDGKTGSGLTSQEQSKYSTGAQKDTSTNATKQVSPVATEGSPASKTIDTAASTTKSSTTSATSNIDNDAMDTSEDSSASSNSSSTNPASPGTPGETLGSPPPSTGTEA